MTSKTLIWVGRSRADIQGLPEAARRQLGSELREVQRGDEPRDWKPMRSVGVGAIEIRVRVGSEFRLIYVARFPDAIYVLHVFQKKSQKTSHFDVALARARYAAVRVLRKET